MTNHAVKFLYTTIYINSINKLESNLYVKPIDRTLLLHENCFHIKHAKALSSTAKHYDIDALTIRDYNIITDNKRMQQRLENLLIALIH
jgi:hypothetical protein